MSTIRPHRILMLALVLLLPRTMMSQERTSAEARVQALVAEYDRSWDSKDTAGVGRLLADRYQYFSSIGDVQSRADILQFLASPEYVLEDAKRSEVVVTRTGSVAIVSSRWQGHGTYKGKSFVDDQRCGQVWLESGRAWRIVSEHCVQITPNPY